MSWWGLAADWISGQGWTTSGYTRLNRDKDVPRWVTMGQKAALRRSEEQVKGKLQPNLVHLVCRHRSLR
jgi:hypothetical protein